MELTLWTYEGPPHVGAMRIAASMQGVHYVLPVSYTHLTLPTILLV